MSGILKTQKTLEIHPRVRTSNVKENQSDLSHVFVSKDALLDLRWSLEGEPCYIWKTDDPERRRQIIVLPSLQPLKKDVGLFIKGFKEECGFKLEDKCTIAPCGELLTADCAVLRDITNDGSELNEKDRPHWEWLLEDKLRHAEHIFNGMIFELYAMRLKRKFVVINSGIILPNSLARFTGFSSAKISDKEIIEQISGPRPPIHIAGMEGIDQALTQLTNFFAKFDRAPRARRSCGVLLHGAHGTGKTMLLGRICQTGWGKVFSIDRHMNPPTVRELFKKAKQGEPSIIAVDSIDFLVSKEDSRPNEFELTLGDEMDSLIPKQPPGDLHPPRVAVVATTTSLNKIPLSLRKRGRFATDIVLPVPDVDARKRILKSLVPDASKVELALIDRLGEHTYAYTPQDLGLLLDKAYENAREDDELTQGDIDNALALVRPTAMRDITLKPPKVRWNEIGGQEDVKRALRQALEDPLKHPEDIARLAITPKKGVLLYGPPGCSKTLSAQATATEIGFNFFAVKGAELLNMYVGESERAVREVFARARAANPSIIFFDEIEAIGSKRPSDGRNGGVNVLTTLLNEMDGIETLKGVTVLAATNQPEALDLALLRPGRFDDLLYVAPPDQLGREAILQVWKDKSDWDDSVDIPQLSRLADGYSGAEVVAVCQKAAGMAFRRLLDTGIRDSVRLDDFLEAMKTVKKQITPAMLHKYKIWAAGVDIGSALS